MSFFRIGLSILFAAAMWVPAIGQAIDPNLQVRIETLTPPPDTKPRLPETERVTVQERRTVTTSETIMLSEPEQKRRLDKILAKRGQFLTLEKESIPSLLKRFNIPDRVVKKRKKLIVVSKTIEKPKPRVTTVSGSISSQLLFDTNAAKTPASRSDWVLGTTGLLTVNIPVATADSLVFQTGIGDQRYARLTFKDVDILINNLTYNQLLQAVPGGGKIVSDKTMTIDTLSYAVSSSTVFASGFNPYLVELFTPSVSWARSNINLSGSICGPIKQEAFCTSGTLATGGEYTFSDAANQRNFAVKVIGGVTWQTSLPGVTTSVSGSIQGKHYTEFVGGRDDLILQAVGRVDWNPNPNLALSGVVQVIRQFSTVPGVQFSGLALYPVMKLQMKF